jgi:hypothetical protein
LRRLEIKIDVCQNRGSGSHDTIKADGFEWKAGTMGRYVETLYIVSDVISHDGRQICIVLLV